MKKDEVRCFTDDDISDVDYIDDFLKMIYANGDKIATEKVIEQYQLLCVPRVVKR